MELSNLIEISKQVFEISDVSELGAAISEKLNDVNTFQKWADLVPDIRDYNKIISEKNACKLVINETLAKAMKLPVSEFKQDISPDKQMYEFMEKISGEKPVKPDYITFTKNKGECAFKANDPEHLSTIFLSVLQMWKQHIMYLNEQENVILAEYRDAILPELMSGKLEV